MRVAVFLLSLFAAVAFGQSDSSVALGPVESYPPEYSAILVAAAKALEARGLKPSEYRARVASCESDVCDVSVYPQELDSAEWRDRSYRGCPLKFCATMTYSKSSQAITKVVGWL
jgi:hypothetical protein